MWYTIFLSAALVDLTFLNVSLVVRAGALVFAFVSLVRTQHLSFAKGFVWGLLVFGVHFFWLAVLLMTKSQAPVPLAIAGYLLIVLYFSLTSGMWFFILPSREGREGTARVINEFIFCLISVGYLYFIENYSLIIFGHAEGYPFLNPLICLAEWPPVLWLIAKVGVLVRWAMFGSALTITPMAPGDVHLVYLPPVAAASHNPVAAGQRVYHKLAGITFPPPCAMVSHNTFFAHEQSEQSSIFNNFSFFPGGRVSQPSLLDHPCAGASPLTPTRKITMPGSPDICSIALTGQNNKSAARFVLHTCGVPLWVTFCDMTRASGASRILASVGGEDVLFGPVLRSCAFKAHRENWISKDDSLNILSGNPKGRSRLWCPEIVKRWGQAHLLAPALEAPKDDIVKLLWELYIDCRNVNQFIKKKINKKLIIVTPETFYPYSLNLHPEQVALWASALPDDAYMIVGSQLSSGRKFYQAAYLLHNGLIKKNYVKHHCAPFVEKIPKLWRQMASLRAIFLQHADEFSRGKQVLADGVFDIGDDIRLVPQICSEFFFKTNARQIWEVCRIAPNKKHAIVLMVNDSWFVGYFKRMLTAIAALKAAYLGLPVAYVGHEEKTFLIYS